MASAIAYPRPRRIAVTTSTAIAVAAGPPGKAQGVGRATRRARVGPGESAAPADRLRARFEGPSAGGRTPEATEHELGMLMAGAAAA